MRFGWERTERISSPLGPRRSSDPKTRNLIKRSLPVLGDYPAQPATEEQNEGGSKEKQGKRSMQAPPKVIYEHEDIAL